MRRRSLARASVGLAACSLALLASPPTVDAATLEQQGWWYRLHAAGVPAEVPARPDVGDDQLLVEGTPEGPTAIAAVRFDVDEGETNPVLSLAVAQHTGTPATTVVLACAAGLAWQPATGGTWEDRPFPDCTTSVQGTPSADGTAWSFPLAALESQGVVDVVLVPGKLPDGPDAVRGSTFGLVLEHPALTTTPGITGTVPNVGAQGGPTPTVPAPGAGGSGVLPLPPVGGGITVPTVPPGSVGAPTSSPSPTATVPPADLGSAPASSTRDDRPRWLGFLIMAAALAAAFAADRLPVAAPSGGADGEVGGLGRFARPRTGPPPRLV